MLGKKEDEINLLGHLTRTMKSYSSRAEGKAWTAVELSRSLLSLEASSPVPLSSPPLPSSQVFSFPTTSPCVSFYCPYTSCVSCISSWDAYKKTTPFRSYKPDHLRCHLLASQQANSQGLLLSPSQLTVTMVDDREGWEVEIQPNVKNCPGALLSAKNTSEQTSVSQPIF